MRKNKLIAYLEAFHVTKSLREGCFGQVLNVEVVQILKDGREDIDAKQRARTPPSSRISDNVNKMQEDLWSLIFGWVSE